jgi:zinc protease
MMMTEFHWTEVDHVITMWTDAPSPLRAGLLFRTGSVDETLAVAGQTHLIEHLALSTVGDREHRHNGFVGSVVTGFFTMGQPQEVSSFLASVCDALTSLPGNRLEGEKQILAAENAARPYDYRSNLLIWRYGATGYGLIGMPQLGLRSATMEQLRGYSAQRFTKENAVLWLSGPPPADLQLRLPHGMKQPPPALTPIQQTFPSWFVDNACGGVAAGSTVPRVSASTIFCEIAAKRLRERLRTVQAVSYAPRVFYDHLNADTAHLVLYADSDKDHRAELASIFGEVFEGFGQVDDAEVETARQQLLERWTGTLAPPLTDRIVMDVQRAAMDWIFGKEFESTEALVAEMLSVTASDVSKFGRDAQATAMFALPGKAAMRPWAGKPAPPSSGHAVQGREILSIDAPIQRERLVNGSDGVSVLFPNGSHWTARYSDLAAALYYEDGCVRLIGSDATTVIVEPTLWRDGQNVCRKIRERVPVHLLLAQGSRSADAIPKPKTTAWQRFRALLTRR